MKENLNARQLRQKAKEHLKILKSFWITFLTTGLFTVLALLGVAFFLSTAWFASNKNVSASGMTVTYETTSNLVIAKNESELRNLASLENAFEITYNSASKLKPATHIDDLGTPYTGLQYVTNRLNVSADTGLEIEPTLNYANVRNASNKIFYQDFTAYIAAYGSPIELKSLTMSLSASSDLQYDYQHALSIDAYRGEPGRDTYLGTLNLADLTKSIVIFNDGSTVSAHNDTENSPIVVTLRAYYDGELKNSSGNAYVHSSETGRAPININVQFVGEE